MINICFKLVCRLSGKKQSSQSFGIHLVKLGLQILIHVSFNELFIFWVFLFICFESFWLIYFAETAESWVPISTIAFLQGVHSGFIFFFSLNSPMARSYSWRTVYRDFSMSFWTFWRDNFFSFLDNEQVTARGHVSEVSWSQAWWLTPILWYKA